MLKNSFWVTLVLASACAPEPKLRVLLPALEITQSQDTEFDVERRLASSGQCLKDTFTVANLKDEIAGLEAKYRDAAKVRGRWKHLDLTSLPVPQANFLKEFGDKLGDRSNPRAHDFQSCADVPCLYNVIYDKEEHVAGYVHYLWYLKFGNMLAASNLVQDQISPRPGIWNGKEHPLKSYLYSDSELYGFWRSSHLVSASHARMPRLREIHRLPRGEGFEKKDFAGSCGLAWSNGFIVLGDACLAIHSNPDKGYLYHALTHELSHHIDFEEGRRLRKTFRSHEPDYLALSNFYLHEYVDDTGAKVREWKHQPGIKLVSNYAGTTPQENFADTIAHYRLDGDGTKLKITSEHYAFTGSSFFSGKEFVSEAQYRSWIDGHLNKIDVDLAQVVISCHEGPAEASSTFFGPQDFQVSVLPSILNCIGSQAEAIERELRGRIMLREPEACGAFTNAKFEVWKRLLKPTLAANFEVHLKAAAADPEYLRKIRIFYEELGKREIAREALFTCLERADEEHCYSQETSRLIVERGENIGLPGHLIDDLALLYKERHSFAEVLREADLVYETFVNSQLDLVRTQVEGTWTKCSAAPIDDSRPPRGQKIVLAGGYLVSSLYNCLEDSLVTSSEDLARAFTVGGLAANHPKEITLIARKVEAHAVRFLSLKYLEERSREAREAENFLSREGTKLRGKLLDDLSWVQSITDEQQIQRDCLQAGVRRTSFNPKYHLKKDLFETFIKESVCPGINGTPKFESWLMNSKGKIIPELEIRLLQIMKELANSQARACLRTYPADNVISRFRFKRIRDACLLDEWPSLEAAALARIESDPWALKLRLRRDDFRFGLIAQRQELQLKVMSENDF